MLENKLTIGLKRGRAAAMRWLSVISVVGISGSVMSGGCASEECLDNKNSLPLAGFYASGSDDKSGNPRAISLDSVSIYGIGAPGDSILQDSVRALSQTYLPFQIEGGETRYVIRYLQASLSRLALADTIVFRYEAVPFFTGAQCGAIYEYRDIRISTTHTFIDSVVCPAGQITNAATENIKIYFRVATDDQD